MPFPLVRTFRFPPAYLAAARSRVARVPRDPVQVAISVHIHQRRLANVSPVMINLVYGKARKLRRNHPARTQQQTEENFFHMNLSSSINPNSALKGIRTRSHATRPLQSVLPDFNIGNYLVITHWCLVILPKLVTTPVVQTSVDCPVGIGNPSNNKYRVRKSLTSCS